MPRNKLMRYEGHPNYRWYKMEKGIRYRVTCDELGMPRNETESYQAANEWWTNKLAELNVATKYPSYKNVEPDEHVGPYVAGKFFGPVETAKTIGPNLDRFLDLERSRMKPQSYRELRRYLERLTEEGKEFFRRDLPLEKITATTVDDHYAFLSRMPIEPGGKNKYLGFFRRFVGWMDMRELIQAPKNLRDKLQRFKDPPKKIRTYDNVADVVNALPDEQKLWALLGLNCAMTQADWGELDWNQIDLKKGTLERKRVKLENVKNAPTVTYKLWPETLALLKARPSKTGLVFRSSTGRAMYVVEYVQKNGKTEEKKTDYFSTTWNRLNPKPKISPAKFRNIGTTALNKNPLYSGFLEVYLANTPVTITKRNYAAEHDNPFFKALEYIRQQTIAPRRKK